MGGKNSFKRNSPHRLLDEDCTTTKRVADEEDASPAIPPVVEPVVVENALTVVLPHVRHVAIVVVDGRRATHLHRKPSESPPFDISQGCILCGAFSPQVCDTKYLCIGISRRTLSRGLPNDILANGPIQISIA